MISKELRGSMKDKIKNKSKSKSQTKILVITLGLIGTLVATQARASLGKGEGTVAQDMGPLSATSHTTVNYQNFKIHEIGAIGLRLREYVSKSGVVFGLAWNGISQPSLSLLLADYFDEYSKTIAHPAKRRLRGSSRATRGSSIIVEKSGHLRNFFGRAYVPGLIPTGVTVNEIK
jgi:hypothetical protein